MSDAGLTSEQRAAIAVHNATQNRMCLNLSGNGQICVACSEVADQIDAAVAYALVGASKALSEKEEVLAAARRECDAAHRLALAIAFEKRTEWEAAGSRDHASGASTVAVALRAAFIAERKRLGLEPYLLPVPESAALAAPAAGEEGKR